MQRSSFYGFLPYVQILEYDPQNTSKLRVSTQGSISVRKFFDGDSTFCSLLLFQAPSNFAKSLMQFLAPMIDPQQLQQSTGNFQNNQMGPVGYKPPIMSGFEAATSENFIRVALIDAIDLFSYLRYSTSKDEYSLRSFISTYLLASHICIYLKDFEHTTINQEFTFLHQMTKDFYSCMPHVAPFSLIVFVKISDDERDKYAKWTTETFIQQIAMNDNRLISSIANGFKNILFFPLVLEQDSSFSQDQVFTSSHFINRIAEGPKTGITDSSGPLEAFEFPDLVMHALTLVNTSMQVPKLMIKSDPANYLLKVREEFELRYLKLREEMEEIARKETSPIRELFTEKPSNQELIVALSHTDEIDTFDIVAEFDAVKKIFKKKVKTMISSYISDFEAEIEKVAKYQNENVARMMKSTNDITEMKKSLSDGKVMDEIMESIVKEMTPLIDKRKKEVYLEAQAVRMRVLRKHVQVCDNFYDCNYGVLHMQNPVRKWIEWRGSCYCYFYNPEAGHYYYFNFGKVPKKAPTSTLYTY